VKKNSTVTLLYGAQSFIVVLLLLSTFLEYRSDLILVVALFTFIVKVIAAPSFINKLIRKHELTFSSSSYLNLPLTLIVLTGLTVLAHSHLFTTLTGIVTGNEKILALSLSGIFISIFLTINRKGALSQIVGILSLENSILLFGLYAGLEQSPAFEIGIIFDIAIWLTIATIFISIVYRHFGSLDVTFMRKLKD
jgi:hydrogenase-4 component E